MKGLITYSSKTGNTKKLAEKIYDRLKNNFDIELKALDDDNFKDLEKYSYILHGFWTRMTKIDNKSKKFLSKLGKDKIVGLFGTSGGEHLSEHGKRLHDDIKSELDKLNSIGCKMTLGKVNPDMLSKMDGIIGNLVPKKMKEYIKEMAEKSREATDEERNEVAEFFENKLKEIL